MHLPRPLKHPLAALSLSPEPDPNLFASILQQCLHTGQHHSGRSVHAHIVKAGLHFSVYVMNNLITFYAKSGWLADAGKLFDEMPLRNIFSWNTILSMYAKSGRVSEARWVFERMPLRDPVSWTTLIVGYNQLGRFGDAIRMFVAMFSAGILPSHFTFSNVLSSCAAMRCMDIGRKVHAFAVKLGMSSHASTANSLLNMYGKSGDLMAGKAVFDRMNDRSVSSWNTMISMYAQAGRLDTARQLFEEMTDRNVISWNALIAGYNQNDSDLEALNLFSEMVKEVSISPDGFTFTNVLSACANLQLLEQGKQVHAHILTTNADFSGPLGNALISMYSKSGDVSSAQMVVEQNGASDLDVVSCTALLEGYVKLGNLQHARKIFSSMKNLDVVAWTAMIVGYVQNGLHKDAIELFREMVHTGPKPNNYTLAAMLSICSTLAAENFGKQIHSKAIRSGEKLSVSVGNALITMYSRAGNIKAARLVFKQVSGLRQTVSWTSMIIALAQHGFGEEAIALFENMLRSEIKPDHITYVGVISACTHVGLVEQGKNYFAMMQNVHRIKPTPSHYACMIDLFARAGMLHEAQDFIEKMPIEPDAIAWGSLLAACKVYKNAELAKMASERLLTIEPENSGAYTGLANAYSACGKWKDAAEIWKSMRDRGVKKEQGFSWIVIKNTVHVFGAEDGLHPQREKIFEAARMVWIRIKKAGFIPDTASVLHDIDDELKEKLLSRHSEKLAIAFGLIRTSEKTTLRIMKNLRVCNDCHLAIKFISKVFDREIVVRDATRFHHFKDGHCSCKDYW